MRRSPDNFPVTLFGEFAEPGASFQPVVIASLGSTHCSARVCGNIPEPGTRVDVWIGAIGPLGAQVAERSAAYVTFRFNAPLAGAVIGHFAGVGPEGAGAAIAEERWAA